MIPHLLTRLRASRDLSLAACYGWTTLIVLAAFGARIALSRVLPGAPFLLFLPAIVLASVLFNRGSGMYATLLSAGLALYFFIRPVYTLRTEGIEAAIHLGLYVAIGLFIAGIVGALRKTVDQLADREAQAQKMEAVGRSTGRWHTTSATSSPW